MLVRLVRGGVAGLMATAAMSIILILGKVLGLMGTAPPKQITARAERRAGAPPRTLPQPLFQISWLAAHAGFGALCGAIYTLLRRFVPGSRWIAGPVYGLALWATNYVGLLPALGLYPPPEGDSLARTGVMIAAHEVYGLTLAELE